MLALTLEPGTAGSLRLDEVPAPRRSTAQLLVRAVALGVCGTDREIADGLYGSAPAGRARLILGHESLGRVAEAPPESRFRRDDLVVGIVRHPDPVPCASCAAGEWDMCRNGRYTEHGIKELDGFGAELYVLEPDHAVPVDPSLGTLGVLLEPTSVIAKAWEHTERIGARAAWTPRTALVTGAGPVGLLAALLGVQRGLEVHVYDRLTEGAKPRLVRQLGAHYHSGDLAALPIRPDLVIECTGASSVVLDVVGRTTANGIVCLAGLSSGGRTIAVDVGSLNRSMVLENDVVFGSVNANRRHYEAAAAALTRADPAWLAGLITRRVPLDRWREALEKRPDDVKAVIELSA